MRIKRIVIIALVAAICMVLLTSTALATGSNKNETVYAALNSDGSVEKIYLVNQLIGEYADYGTYTEIKNLSTSSVPAVDGDKITFPDKEVEGGLYYQGTMMGELPMTFDISYVLDGKDVSAEELSGANGHLMLTVKASQNILCDATIRDGLMAQITAKLDAQFAENISAPDSTAVAVGRTVTINYVVMPGEEGTMRIEADIQDFRMDQITITLLKGTIVIGDFDEKLDEYDSGFNEMIDGTNDMVDGMTDLKDGMETLADGMGDLSSGLGRLRSGGKELYSGMKEYGGNLSDYLAGVQGIVQPSTDIQVGLSGLADNGSAVAQGISNISDGLSTLSASSADLKALAESLAVSEDPQIAALAAGTLQTLSALDEMSSGLEPASNSLDAYITGVQQTAEGYAQFHNGLQALADGSTKLVGAYDDIVSGTSDYMDGVSSSASGAKKIYKSVKGLPDDIQALIDGQIEFKDGILTAKEEMSETKNMFITDDEPPVSFASPEKNHPDSVQYILMTPVIEKKETKTEAREENETSHEDFLTRFAALFN